MFDSILIVCTGNICRSPIAERILRSILTSKKIDSAGVDALVDKPADNSAIRVAEKYGISLNEHCARQFNASLSSQYNLILVMEKLHLERISKLSPESRGKTLLLGHWLGSKEIPDPYRKSDEAFDSVFRLINQACQRWAEKLKN